MTKREIEIETRVGRVAIKATVAGDYAAHRSVREVDGKLQATGRRWCVTHIQTGRVVLDDLAGAAHAQAVMAGLSAVAGLSAAIVALIASPTDASARCVVSGALAGLRDRALDVAARPA